MEIRAGQVVVNYVEHGTGRPVLVLHGAGVDHREAEACFEPLFDDRHPTHKRTHQARLPTPRAPISATRENKTPTHSHKEPRNDHREPTQV
jgi:hypothetical protein